MASPEYRERVYAGVLGKTIGVMLGKPFEGWEPERIEAQFGVVRGYVHDQVGYPLICTDDDTSGTFTFVRAVEDAGALDVGRQQIGEAWLNYLVENRSVLWWGGVGASTEHTAYLRLKEGVPAPESGSARRNGKRVSEQIGAQIFIDSWAMLCPGDPEKAAELARRAASVSHDGEAVYGAQVLAAMEALAFDEPSIARLVECGLSVVPSDSVIAGIVRDVREWAEGGDWRSTRRLVDARYGAKLHGVGHMTPNHALIHLALWHGGGDFAESLVIVNTCGWDTDCNSGNLGCLLGIRNGLAGIPADLRDPIADRMYLPTADSGRGISDCLREADALVGLARGGCEHRPRFDFSLPGAVQGFTGAAVSNPDGMGLRIPGGATATTPTFIPPDLADMHGYELMTSPTLYPGQTLRAQWDGPVGAEASLVLHAHGAVEVRSPWSRDQAFEWTVPDLETPIYEVGISFRWCENAVLRSLDWSGAPTLDLLGQTGEMARRMWVESIESLTLANGVLTLAQNRGQGMALLGCREWRGYAFEADVMPRTGGRFGIAVCVQGLRRYVSLDVSTDGTIELAETLDGRRQVLAAAKSAIEIDQTVTIRLHRSRTGFEATAPGCTLQVGYSGCLDRGGIAFLVDATRLDVMSAKIKGGYV